MFTGIIEEVGHVSAIEPLQDGIRITVAASLVTDRSSAGDSIAVNGVCLTVINMKSNAFAADVSAETLDRSTLGGLAEGSPVNLERAVTPQTRMGGHIVQGHVDARGELVSSSRHGDFYTIKIRFPAEISRYLVYKGSVAVEGISLTIARLADDFFEIAVIPKTWDMTNLSSLKSGDAVNLEVDVIAKYVERMLEHA
jgi:riboflavin synthase